MTKKEFDALQVGDIITAKYDKSTIAVRSHDWKGEVISKEYPFIKAKTTYPNYHKDKIVEHLKYTDYKIQK